MSKQFSAFGVECWISGSQHQKGKELREH